LANISKKALKRLQIALLLLKSATELKKIYTNYYIGNKKDFIELLGIIAENGLDRLAGAIDKLKSIGFSSINTDKIKLLV